MSSSRATLVPLAIFGGAIIASAATPVAPAVSESVSTTATTAPASAVSGGGAALSLAEARKIVSTSRRYEAHPTARTGERKSEPQIIHSPDFEMSAPPPAPRAEMQPPAPNSGMVWVAGHYMPVKGEWKWVTGEWDVPATPVSVWIAGRYDDKEKRWTPGYWQPDRPSAPETDVTKPGGKAVPNSGY